jgi:lysozyme family protein
VQDVEGNNIMRLTPSDRFNFAVQAVLKHEGGFSNDPKDPGGATNYGISLRFLKEMDIDFNHDGQINIDDVKEITFSDAVEIYKKYWWDKYAYEAINSLRVSTKIFDMAVNMGAVQAHQIVQESCSYCGHQLVPDGILGVKTILSLNEISLHGREQDLMDEIVNNQKWFYEHLAEKYPSLKVFLKGWLNRAAWGINAIS